MGMIFCIKVGYKIIMLNITLVLFDEDEGYELAAERRKKQTRVRKCLLFGEKPTLIYAMEILDDICKFYNNHAKLDGIKSFWRKENILFCLGIKIPIMTLSAPVLITQKRKLATMSENILVPCLNESVSRLPTQMLTLKALH